MQLSYQLLEMRYIILASKIKPVVPLYIIHCTCFHQAPVIVLYPDCCDLDFISANSHLMHSEVSRELL